MPASAYRCPTCGALLDYPKPATAMTPRLRGTIRNAVSGSGCAGVIVALPACVAIAVRWAR